MNHKYYLAMACAAVVWPSMVLADQAGSVDTVDAPPAETASVVAQPAEHGSVQLGYGYSELTDNNAAWNDVFARGNVGLGDSVGVLNWEVSKQRHFGESGQAISASLTRDLGPNWYGSIGLGLGSGADFLTKRRVDVAVYRKWLPQRNLITGLQFTGSRSGDGVYSDKAWQASSSYYFASPLVAEVGVKRTTSNPGDVNTMRYYVAGTYGVNKQYSLSARYDTGREGYMPQGFSSPAVNFKSNVATVSWRQWLSPRWGYELQAERYHNPSYNRKGVTASVFYDF